MTTVDSFGSKGVLDVAGAEYEIFRLKAVEGAEKLPYSLKVLLENLLRTEDGANVTAEQIKALASWDPTAEPDTEIQFTPARVIMQDFTGVPCVVDLATMREAIKDLGGDPARFLGRLGQPLGAQPVDRGLHVAVGFLQRLLGVHHPRAGRLAQVLHHRSRNGHGRLLVSHRVRRG